MKLHRYKPRMLFQLDDFHQIALRVDSRKQHVGVFKPAAVQIIKFIAMPMALTDFVHFISLLRLAVFRDHAAERTEPERTAELYVFLVGHQVDNGFTILDKLG